MNKRELSKISTVHMKNELSWDEYLTVVTDEDCQDETFCKYFQSDPYWRHQFYLLRKNNEALTKETLGFEEEDFKEFKQKVWEEIISKDCDKQKVNEMIVQYIKSKHNFKTLTNSTDDNKKDIFYYRDGIYVDGGQYLIETVTRNILDKAFTPQFATIVIKKIAVDTYVTEDFLNFSNINEVAVNNGILNIKTRELSDFTPEKVFFQKLPVNYDPNETGTKVISFIKDVVDEDSLVTLQEFFGYSLYRDYGIEKALMLLGTGRNGKSQLLELLKNMLGINNCSNLDLKTICENDFAKAQLKNKLVNLGCDIGDTYIEDSSLFKSLTGNDVISADRKFQSRISFKNYAKFVFSCNNLPRSKDDSKGFWDRWMLIKFPYTFEYEDKIKLLPKEEQSNYKIRKNNVLNEICIPEEMSGLLNWSLDGLDRLMKTGHYTFNKATEDVKSKWIKEADSLHSFCEELIDEDSDCMITKNEFKQCYHLYCKKHKIKAVNDKTIKNHLTTKLGVFDSRAYQETEQAYVWKNIKFKKSYGNCNNLGFSICDKITLITLS